MELSELFWNASLDELKKGYVVQEEHYVCLLCGSACEKGIIYPVDGMLYEAQRYIRLHIRMVHQSVFDYLLGLDKRLTGLTDHQNSLLRLFYQELSDAQIQKELGIGSASTIRNHRFVLKEKERQSKIFLALMELLKAKDKHAPRFVDVHQTATMIDDRYNVTLDEQESLLQKYFPDGKEGGLKSFPAKQKQKLIVLRQIASRFVREQTYSEKEVNELLKAVYEDFATLRRYLIEYGFLNRKPDGSEYWVAETETGYVKKEEPTLNDRNRRKELQEQYKEVKIEAGVYQILNTVNDKRFVDASPNLRNLNGRKFELNSGGHTNKKLQADWKQYGEAAFKIEVLELVDIKDSTFFSMKDELKKLEEKWLEKLQPYGEKGYNSPPK
ncbi:DUF2087 domain-containing protein [Paenibacillus filicis]|uniref:DUF2087 domain-containing protein n=1 Tax=Paenibacillus filicis TaxID=669464 RepID=A0ABU9DJH7_9BACL